MPPTRTRSIKAEAKAAALRMTAESGAETSMLPLGDHPDTLGIIHRAVVAAAKAARAENDRLGIATPGADKDGKIVYSRPPRRRAGRTPNH